MDEDKTVKVLNVMWNASDVVGGVLVLQMAQGMPPGVKATTLKFMAAGLVGRGVYALFYPG